MAIRKFLCFLILCSGLQFVSGQSTDSIILIKSDRLFDGYQLHTGWGVWIQGNKILAAGPLNNTQAPIPQKTIELKGKTLLPGLIEGHSHLLLHPYNETKWADQVLDESEAERVARAVMHARATLMAGFTTVRDLGTEGAGYADVGLKKAIEEGIIIGPRMLIATRAIVASGSYGPRLGNEHHQLVRGAAEADGIEGISREARTQIGNGADLIKVYADYRWGSDKKSSPTFTLEELQQAVAVSTAAGRKVVAHASTPEGMKRAAQAGVSTIEHGDYATEETFDWMLKNQVALCPTLSAAEATATYDGWNKKTMPPTERIAAKMKSFQLALSKKVTICFGGDVGVFSHGDNAREMELMVAYGMPAIDALRSATSVNAKQFGLSSKIGKLEKGLLADIIAVDGNPLEQIKDIRNIVMVMKDGTFYVKP